MYGFFDRKSVPNLVYNKDVYNIADVIKVSVDSTKIIVLAGKIIYISEILIKESSVQIIKN